MMITFFHVLGTKLKFRQSRNIKVRIGTNWAAHSFRTVPLSPSGPGTLCGLNPCSTDRTSLVDSLDMDFIQSRSAGYVFLEVC